MKIVSDISITSRPLRPLGPGTPVIITATVPPGLGMLRDGDRVQDALSAGARDTANYASSEGAIAAVSAAVTINGATGDVTDSVAFADVVSVALTVTDTAGNARVFGTAIRTVSGIAPMAQSAPVISGTPAAGAMLTVTPGTYSGTPAPTLAGTLTLDGVDVTGEMDGLAYTIPSDAAGADLQWVETAGNGIAPEATQSVSVTVQAGDVGETPDPVTQKVYGGSEQIITEGGQTWHVHTFLESDVIDVRDAVNVEYLVVGGGGASGKSGPGIGGGGGGAGGYGKFVAGEPNNTGASTLELTPGVHLARVAPGGLGGSGVLSNTGNQGTNGGFSELLDLRVEGGGAGGVANGLTAAQAIDGTAGGSGGGGTGSLNTTNRSFGGAGIAGQGFAGGDGSTDSDDRSGAGGGGALEAGANGFDVPNKGGDGVQTSIDGTAKFYAGGGGGGGARFDTGDRAGPGGLGGGGDGSIRTDPSQPGAPNTGGGAGASGINGESTDGGTGIVIIRYPTTATSVSPPPIDTSDPVVTDTLQVLQASHSIVLDTIVGRPDAAETIHMPAPGTDRVIVAFVSYRATGTQVSEATLTLGGNAFTRLGVFAGDGQQNDTIGFVMKEADIPAGPSVLKLVVDGTMVTSILGLVEIGGADQTNPVASWSANNSSPTSSTNATAGNLLAFAAARRRQDSDAGSALPITLVTSGGGSIVKHDEDETMLMTQQDTAAVLATQLVTATGNIQHAGFGGSNDSSTASFLIEIAAKSTAGG